MDRRLAEDEDAHPDQRDRGEGECPVHVGEAEALGDPGPDRERLGPRAAVSGRVHHSAASPSSSPPLSGASSASCLAKYASRIFLAAGAAEWTPHPPSSMVTQV